MEARHKNMDDFAASRRVGRNNRTIQVLMKSAEADGDTILKLQQRRSDESGASAQKGAPIGRLSRVTGRDRSGTRVENLSGQVDCLRGY